MSRIDRVDVSRFVLDVHRDNKRVQVLGIEEVRVRFTR